jgi:predicted XRE-type DNA-binding protein
MIRPLCLIVSRPGGSTGPPRRTSSFETANDTGETTGDMGISQQLSMDVTEHHAVDRG